MRKAIYTFLVCLLVYNCSFNDKTDEIKIGEKLAVDMTIINENWVLFYEPNSGMPAKEIFYDGIKYIVYLSEEAKAKAIWTYDSRFKSLEDYKVGMPYSKIKSKTKELIISGYGCHVELPSGWTAVLIDDRILQNQIVSDTSSIKCFYKTDFGSWASKYKPNHLKIAE